MTKITFEDRIPEIIVEIDKRRNRWTLQSVPFEDVSQILLLRAFNKYHTFNEKKGIFSHWLQRLISRTIINLLRDNYTIYSRPCIQGCIYNLGEDSCSFCKTGVQCAECPLYARWEKKKKDHYNVAQSLPMENHEKEVNSSKDEFVDIQGAKKVIDEKIKNKLNDYEWRVYKYLFINNMEIKEAAEKIFPISKDIVNKKDIKKIQNRNYLTITKVKKKIVLIAKIVIEEEDLA